MKLNPEYDNAEFALVLIDQSGNTVETGIADVRFRRKDVGEVVIALKRKDFKALHKLAVPEYLT